MQYWRGRGSGQHSRLVASSRRSTRRLNRLYDDDLRELLWFTLDNLKRIMQRIGNTLEYSIKISRIICNYSLNKLKVKLLFHDKDISPQTKQKWTTVHETFFFQNKLRVNCCLMTIGSLHPNSNFSVVEKNRIFWFFYSMLTTHWTCILTFCKISDF